MSTHEHSWSTYIYIYTYIYIHIYIYIHSTCCSMGRFGDEPGELPRHFWLGEITRGLSGSKE